MKGRKRHLVVDTTGLLLDVCVHGAGVQDRDGGKRVLEKLRGRFPRLRHLWADGAYAGDLVRWASEFGNWTLEIVRKHPETRGFAVVPRRWVVERTLAWLGRSRRLSKDYEESPETSENFIFLSMTHLMLRRLAPP